MMCYMQCCTPTFVVHLLALVVFPGWQLVEGCARATAALGVQ